MTSDARSADQALRAALKESLDPTRDYRGYCLRAVRQLLGVAAGAPNAAAAWKATPDEHRHAGLAPPGAPIFWAIGQHGHVALSAGHGLCWTTDLLRGGKLDIVPVALIRRRWGADLLGWTSSLNGVRVPRG